jgi:hypothetical protein
MIQIFGLDYVRFCHQNIAARTAIYWVVFAANFACHSLQVCNPCYAFILYAIHITAWFRRGTPIKLIYMYILTKKINQANHMNVSLFYLKNKIPIVSWSIMFCHSFLKYDFVYRNDMSA